MEEVNEVVSNDDTVWIPFEEVEKFVMSLRDMMQVMITNMDSTLDAVREAIETNEGDNNDGN